MNPKLVIHVVPLTQEPNFGALLVCDSRIIDDDTGGDVGMTADAAARLAWARWGERVPVLFFSRSTCHSK
jgi:hypothetical protein